MKPEFLAAIGLEPWCAERHPIGPVDLLKSKVRIFKTCHVKL